MMPLVWPFGNTDGAHPDEYLKKRYACDGKEVYGRLSNSYFEELLTFMS